MTAYEPGARVLYRTASRKRQRVATVRDVEIDPVRCCPMAYKVQKVRRHHWIPAAEIEGRCLPPATKMRDCPHNFCFEI